MIPMTYGSLPVDRETGGLTDTVIPYNQYTGEGTGFSFRNYEPQELKDKLFESIYLYTHEKAIWRSMVRQAMKQDFGLQKMAIAYEKLYQIILGV